MSIEQPKVYSEEEIQRMNLERERAAAAWEQSKGMTPDSQGWEEMRVFLDEIGVRVEQSEANLTSGEKYLEYKFFPVPRKGRGKAEEPVMVSMFKNQGGGDEEHGEVVLDSDEEWQWGKISLDLTGQPDVAAFSPGASLTESTYHTGIIIRQGDQERRFVLLRSVRQPKSGTESTGA
ncbi:MAG: hypothetical protein WBO92_05245 [Candidatus Moraniibacteriota bacterium]